MLMKKILIAALVASSAIAAQAVTVKLTPKEDAPVIEKEIYGQFTEHLGTCIYGGIWVGPESSIPNTDGYRNDVLQAMRDLHIPVMRWPGGCFADEYHWRDGIGPRSERPRMVNNNWGGTVEDNSFGTNEFFNLCELIGTEPYLSGNVGSGTVAELAQWVEYITAEDGPMAKLRKQNGREKPWKLKYLGVGNESWGCGGNFTPEFYANVYRRYQTYCRDYDGNHLYKIASGASDYDYTWTEVLMKNAGSHMNGISLHYYTIFDWNNKHSATQFTPDEYYWILGKCLEIEPVIKRHMEIMDRYDPQGRVGLLVDEWGTWFDVEPGTNPGHLYQQNTMRDAMVAALSLNVFHRLSKRVKMANIAQFANVLQSMLLTRDDKMVLTPTYYVFKMYVPHQGAKLVDATCDAGYRMVDGDRLVPNVSVTASEKDGGYCISLTNVDLNEKQEIEIPLKPLGKDRWNLTAEILTCNKITDYNDFGAPAKVKLEEFTGCRVDKGVLKFTMPAKSIITINLK